MDFNTSMDMKHRLTRHEDRQKTDRRQTDRQKTDGRQTDRGRDTVDTYFR